MLVVLMVVGSTLYYLHVQREIARDAARTDEFIKRFVENNAAVPDETPAAAEPPGGHWHGDEWHAEPHTAQVDDEKPTKQAEPAPPEPAPTLTRDELPDALPYPMTQENRHIWEALVTEAVADPALMQKLLPDTKERADETRQNFANLNVGEFRAAFEEAMWSKLASQYPNDPEVLWMHATYLYRGDKATRAEKQAYVELWERLKRVNDEHGIPLTSGLRKTHGLSQTYVDLGQYEKAIQNIHEQNDWKAALRRAGIHDRYMNHGILPRGTVIELQKLVDAQRQQRERQRDAQDR